MNIREKIEFLEGALVRMEQVKYMRGKEVAKLPHWYMKPPVELCPELWFWLYPAGNGHYPEMMRISDTPFWSRGQAIIQFMLHREKREFALKELREMEEDNEYTG